MWLMMSANPMETQQHKSDDRRNIHMFIFPLSLYTFMSVTVYVLTNTINFETLNRPNFKLYLLFLKTYPPSCAHNHPH